MASVSYFFGSWVSSGNDLLPGQVHDWVLSGFNYGDDISLSVHPLIEGDGTEQDLSVTAVTMQTSSGGRRMLFTVENTGPNTVDGYGMGFGFISS
jgi:hypothetical protein